jgi:CRP/FNR family transcriptional regulator
MKATRVNGERHVGGEPHASAPYLHSVAQTDTVRSPSAPLRQARDARFKPVEGPGDGVLQAAPHPASDLTKLSLSAGLDPDEMRHVEHLVARPVRFRKGDVLYRCGSGFDTLYAIRAGTCKTVLFARGGQYKVTGYHMDGEIIGLDGICSTIHECEATALEDMTVWPLPFARIEHLAHACDQFRDNLHRLLAFEYSRSQALTIVLATNRADQRLAVFLLDLSQRYQARGFSSCEFVLRMSRAEIGSYLGLKLETVSRQFSRFQREGLAKLDGRRVRLLDEVALNLLAES